MRRPQLDDESLREPLAALRPVMAAAGYSSHSRLGFEDRNAVGRKVLGEDARATPDGGRQHVMPEVGAAPGLAFLNQTIGSNSRP